MSFVLFAIIGVTINVGPWYWVCLGASFAWNLMVAIIKAVEDN